MFTNVQPSWGSNQETGAICFEFRSTITYFLLLMLLFSTYTSNMLESTFVYLILSDWWSRKPTFKCVPTIQAGVYFLSSITSPSLSCVFGNTGWPFTATSFPSMPALLAASAAVLPVLNLIISPLGQHTTTTSPLETEFAIFTYLFDCWKPASEHNCSSHCNIVLSRWTCKIYKLFKYRKHCKLQPYST